GGEDVPQLGLHLPVPRGMVGHPGAWPALEHVEAAHALAEVPPELPLRRLEKHEAIRRRVDLVAHAVAHARRARGPTLEVVGRVARDLALRTLVRLPRLAAVPVHGRGP